LEEEQAIAVRELDPTTHLALKHNQLTSKRGILSLKSADRAERRQKEDEQRDHRVRDSFTTDEFRHTQADVYCGGSDGTRVRGLVREA